jgi:hypothetical protein
VLHLLHRFLLLLALLGTQVMGLHRGYICDCGGVERLTQLDHCHGPHDHGCEHEEHEMPVHDRHDHEEEEPIHEHPALVESPLAEKAQPTAFMSVQAPLLVWLPLDGFTVKTLPQAERARFQPPRINSRAGPPWPSRLSHTISLRI